MKNLSMRLPWLVMVGVLCSFCVRAEEPAPAEIITNGGEVVRLASLAHQDRNAASVVFFTSEITAESLVRMFDALDWKPAGRVGVKVSTGEPPNSNHLRPQLIRDLVRRLGGTIVESNTAYGGKRSSSEEHRKTAERHGFTAIAPVDIQDEFGDFTLPVKNGRRLKENYVGKSFPDYGSYVILSHFKGHSMAGYGGAIKNISVGMASVKGKTYIHSGGTSLTKLWGGDQTAFCEAMAEAGKSVSDYLGNGSRIVYLNVLNRISIDCDCDGTPAEPDIHDIGIAASLDPVALDQACVDLVWNVRGNETFRQRVESRNGLHTLEYAERIGLGTRNYRLVVDLEKGGPARNF